MCPGKFAKTISTVPRDAQIQISSSTKITPKTSRGIDPSVRLGFN